MSRGRRASFVALVMGTALLPAAGVSAGVMTGVSLRAGVAKPETPEQLFATVAPGIVKVVTSCKGGLAIGTGFLVGPRTMVTALHVLRPPDETSCTVSSVKQEGAGGAALVGQIDSYKADDLAVAHLSAPIKGFYFGLTSKQPATGTRIIGLGYSLGNPLSFNQGTVLGFAEDTQVSYMLMNLFGGHGSSGGPILNLQGQVVGLTQQGVTNGSIGVIRSINFGKLAPRGTSLCQGVTKSSQSTLCGSVEPSAIAPTPTSGTPSTQALANTAPPTLVTGSITAREYNAHTIDDKANHIPPPSGPAKGSVDEPAWNGYLRLALIANQDPYGRMYQSTYVRCWSPASFATASAGGQVFSSTTDPLGFYVKGSPWINVTASTCTSGAEAARGKITQTTVVALSSILHETFNRQGIADQRDLTCLGAVGVWEAVNRHIGSGSADRAWALLLDWYSSHLGSTDIRGFNGCVARFKTDWNG